MPALDLRQLRDRYTAKAKEMHDIVGKAESEDRGLTEDEQKKFAENRQECLDLQERIKLQEELHDSFKITAANELTTEQQQRQQREEARKAYEDDESRPLNSAQRTRGLAAWLMFGKAHPSDQDAKYAKRMGLDLNCTEVTLGLHHGYAASGVPFQAPRTRAEAIRQHEARISTSLESRATNIASGATLGLELVPDEMMLALEVARLAYGGMREVSTIISTSGGGPMPMPTMNDTAIEGIEVPEDTLVPDAALTFGQVTLGAYKYSSRIVPISVELLQDSNTPMPALIGAALGDRLGRITNRRFTTGTGVAQPRGITLDSFASGVTAAVANTISFTEMLTLIHSVDPAYRANARFMMHDTIFQRIQQQVDSQARPLWLPNLIATEPGTYMGYPFTINQHMPVAAAAKGVLFGDLSKYHIRDTLGVTLLRLNERYAEFLRVAFLAYLRTDGRLLDAGTHPVKHLILL